MADIVQLDDYRVGLAPASGPSLSAHMAAQQLLMACRALADSTAFLAQQSQLLANSAAVATDQAGNLHRLTSALNGTGVALAGMERSQHDLTSAFAAMHGRS